MTSMRTMTTLCCAIASAISLTACATPPDMDPSVKKLSPILTVEAIEPELGFWVDRLGFQKTVEVPEGDLLGFAIVERDGMEVMLQTHSSVKADDAGLAAELTGGASCLYLEVADLGSVLERLDGVPVVVPKRDTFYGATEVFVRSPGGHVIGLAQMKESAD